jgi:hypothetical protein
LIQKGAEVIVAGTGRSAAFLKEEFPDLEHLHLPGYEVSYPHHGSMSLRMLRRSPVILSAIRREHRILEILIGGHNIGAVISDNRFGIWSEKVPSIYMTHQISIKAPMGWSFTEGLLYMVHRKYIKHFDECWVPDTEEGGGLSGELSHKRKSPVPTYFIGPQSRFELPAAKPEKKYDILAMISGPEPQRSIFEEKLIDQLMNSGLEAMVVLGKPEADEHEVHEKLRIHSHLNSEKLRDAMLASDLIICRSGYSSIMDLASLGKQAAIIPTPGQTEQEYLAWYHKYKQQYFSMPQDDLQLDEVLKESKKYKGIRLEKNTSALEERINNLLESL